MSSRWTIKQDLMLRRHYANMPTKVIAERMARTPSSVYQRALSLGLKKSAKYLATPAACRLRRGDGVGAAMRFRPGHATWNKGMKGLQIGGEETRFSEGHKPQTWLPIGTEVVDRDGVRMRKVADTRNRRKDWRPVHVLLWEEHRGPVSTGHIVVFANRIQADIRIENLECVTRADHMRRNSLHRYPKEIALAIQAIGVLNRQINKRSGASA